MAATFESDTHIVGLIHGFACSRGSQCFYVLLISSMPAGRKCLKHAFDVVESENSRAWSALMEPILAPDVVVADGGSDFPRPAVIRC